MSYRFASLSAPKTLAYRIADDLIHGNLVFLSHSCCRIGVSYDTYGDGLTAHSPDTVIGLHNLGDFCASLLDFMLKNQGDQAIRDLVTSSWPHCRLRQERMAFLAGLRYEESKRAWYHQHEDKVSRSESRRHDKRWEEVPTWADGTPGNALRMVLEGNQGLQLLDKLLIALQAKDATGQTCQHINQWFGMTPGLQDQDALFTIEAVQATDRLVNAFREANYARRSLECWVHNRGVPQQEEVIAQSA